LTVEGKVLAKIEIGGGKCKRQKEAGRNSREKINWV